MRFFDSETMGLVGPMLLLQHATDWGEISLHEIFNSPVSSSLSLIESMCDEEVCGFNLVYDWFHTNKIYNILINCSNKDKPPRIPEVIEIEASNPSEWCLRPKSAIDLMLHARKGKYQVAMSRKKVIIRKVPTILAELLADELQHRIQLPEICFARLTAGYQWKIEPLEGDASLSNLVLTFGGSTSLGAISRAELNEDKADWPVPEDLLPTEVSWRPYGSFGNRPWPLLIYKAIAFWQLNGKARYYAHRDVDLTRRLYHSLGSPLPGDNDSLLAVFVGATRHRGFAIDHSKLEELAEGYSHTRSLFPRGPGQSKQLLHQNMSEMEAKFVTSTKRSVLDEIVKWEDHPASAVAAGIIAARRADKRLDLVEKFKQITTYHPDFKIIGTRSNRMAGGSDDEVSESINPQGIPRDKLIRSMFTLAYLGEQLIGGDAVSFEISILDAVFPDPRLHEELKSGKKFHALLGSIWFNLPYDQCLADPVLYYKCKQADFAWIYGAEDNKLAEVTGQSLEQMASASNLLRARYPGVVKARNAIQWSLCAMHQSGGIGSAISWKEPADYVESFLGFRRYFTLENTICRELYNLANKLPKSFRVEGKITRRDREQTYGGATQTALYAGAFGIQAANMRAAGNHVIQSPGGEICKAFQCELFKQQPVGIHKWKIRAINIHDEILTVTDGTVDTFAVKEAVVQRYQQDVPLLAWEWGYKSSWADK